MKIFLISILLSFAIFVSCGIVEDEFEKWQKKYKTFFVKGTKAYNDAFRVFQENFHKVIKQDLKFFMGESKFRIELNRMAIKADKSVLNGAKLDNFLPQGVLSRALNTSINTTPPPSLDYREKGLVTSVKDQGFSCSSCYAFAAVCGLEGQYAKKYKKLVSFSPQNIVDCSTPFGNQGCEGGYMSYAYDYVRQNRGIASEASYPYTGYTQDCAYKSFMSAVNVTGYKFVLGDENFIKSVLLNVGPLPAAIRGSLDSFYYYSKGIYNDPNCGTSVDHAVCIVGYGTDSSTTPPTDYWIIKNSWSTDWGEDGYFRLKRGTNACGIRRYIVYPIL